MSYASQADLAEDPDFQARVKAVTTAQATIFQNDGRADIAALAHGLLRGDDAALATFVNLLAAAPGFADAVELPDAEIDESLVADADLLAAVQAGWPTVAALYYTPEGLAHP